MNQDILIFVGVALAGAVLMFGKPLYLMVYGFITNPRNPSPLPPPLPSVESDKSERQAMLLLILELRDYVESHCEHTNKSQVLEHIDKCILPCVMGAKHEH